MSTSASKTTSFRWAIPKFQKERDTKNPTKFSDNFALTTRPTFQFALFLNPILNSFDNSFIGVELKQSDSRKPVELKIEFWLENEEGEQFNERLYKKQAFDKVGCKCGFGVDKEGKNWDLFFKVHSENKTLFVCCELSELNVGTFTDHDQVFYQNCWALYEQEIYDAIIKVGDAKFKVSKFLFMARSDVFKKMFQSNFKEGMTSIVEVTDVSENAMKALIKWIYTQQIEDEDLIEELFAAADKYQIRLLKTICIEHMTANLNNENVLVRFALANLHSNNELKNIILEHIKHISKEDSIDWLTSPKWTEFIEKNGKAANEILKTIREKTINK